MKKVKYLFKFFNRIRIVQLLFLGVTFCLISRLYFLQIVQGETYERKAEEQYFAVQDIFNRGNIFFEDKNGEKISAGTLRSGYKLAINPSLLKDPDEVFKKLSLLNLDIDEEDFLFRANKTDDVYEEVVGQLDLATTQRIKDLDLDGIIFARENWRFYPGGSLASNVLGFVAYQEDSLEGVYGVENYYNYVLERKSEEKTHNFFAEIFSNIGGVFLKEEEQKEGDIILTIEPSVQSYLESELQKVSEKWKTDLAGGIIIDPNNGEVYAMAIKPNFDLNNFREADDSLFGNPMVENVYEMGSIIKSLTMAVGFDTEAITPETTYNDRGSLIIDGSKISNYDGRARGVIDMQEILNQSLNVGATFIEQQVGNDKFADYFLKLGLGEETGIDLYGETRGLVSNLDSPRDIEYVTASYGQGIAITPVGTVKALATLANGGLLINPHLVKKIDYTSGEVNEITYPNQERVFSQETTEEVTRMLIEVVDDALLGGTVNSENYTIAAKTGTAQMTKNGEKGYSEDKYLHSFFGYFPATQPRFLVFLYIIDPKEVKYASHTLTEPFMDIFKFLVNYYEVEPDRGGEVE